MDQFQNIKQRIEKKKNMSAVCFGFTQGEEAQVRKVFSYFFLKHMRLLFYCWNLYNIFCRTSCNKVWTSDEHHSASPPTGSRIIKISFICLHNQSQWNEMSSAFSFHPVFVFSLCLRFAKPTLKEIRKI